MTESGRIAVEARISGLVQGVWFRGWVREEARGLGLTGWVRNCSDGSVAALFVGPEAAVGSMLALCHQGPPAARVVAVETVPLAAIPELDDFRVAR